MGVFHVFKIVQMVRNRATQHIYGYIYLTMFYHQYIIDFMESLYVIPTSFLFLNF